MADWRHDPQLNYAYNLLQDQGTSFASKGPQTVDKGMSDLAPSIDSFKRLLSGDTSALLDENQPQIDQVTSQFGQVRKMLSSGPRSGGTASQLAELPTKQIQTISNMVSGSKQGAATNLASAAGQETSTGLSETSQGLSATGAAAGIATQGHSWDLANPTWGKLFQNMAMEDVSGSAGALGKLLGMLIGGA